MLHTTPDRLRAPFCEHIGVQPKITVERSIKIGMLPYVAADRPRIVGVVPRDLPLDAGRLQGHIETTHPKVPGPEYGDLAQGDQRTEAASVTQDHRRTSRHRLQRAPRLREDDIIRAEQRLRAVHRGPRAAPDDVDRDPERPAGLLDRFQMGSDPRIIAEDQGPRRVRRERRARQEAVCPDPVVHHLYPVFRNEPRLGEPFPAIEIHRDVSKDAWEQRWDIVPGQTIVADIDGARVREPLQRLHRLDVVMSVDDLGSVRKVIQVVRYRDAGGGDLSSDPAEFWAIHHRQMAGGAQPQRQVSDHDLGARPPRQVDIGDENTQR